MTQIPVPSPINPVPTSGTGPYDFNSPAQVVTFAMKNAGYLGKGGQPTSEDFAEYIPRLNMILNRLQTKGLKLWLQQVIAITCVQGQNLYTFGPTGNVSAVRPTRFLEGCWQDFAGNRRPLICLSQNEWDYLSTLVTQGSVNSYFVHKNQLTMDLYLWLTPDLYSATQGQVWMLTQVQINNVVGLYDTMNFPIEWFQALHWILAYEISIGQPASIIAICKMNAEKYLQELEDWDVEDASTVFQPDQRTQYVGNKFR
jgi:hypothetical protein